jgi:hypothetical protein
VVVVVVPAHMYMRVTRSLAPCAVMCCTSLPACLPVNASCHVTLARRGGPFIWTDAYLIQARDAKTG